MKECRLLSIKTSTATAATSTETATSSTRSASTEPTSTASTPSTEPASRPTPRCASSTSSRASTPTSTTGLLHASGLGGLRLREETLKREELVASDEDLVGGLEGSSNNAFRDLYSKMELVDGAEDLVNFADGCPVLQVDGGVEVGDHLVD